MGYVKKSKGGYVAHWKVDGLPKQKKFEGPFAFTEAHRWVKERDLDAGIINKPPIQKQLFKGNRTKTTTNYLPIVEEPGIPFSGRERPTNTGYRNIYYTEVGGQHYGTSILDVSKGKRVSNKYLFKNYGGKEGAFAAAKKARDEILFKNQEIRERENGS